jgi:hypothetical protein
MVKKQAAASNFHVVRHRAAKTNGQSLAEVRRSVNALGRPLWVGHRKKYFVIIKTLV